MYIFHDSRLSHSEDMAEGAETESGSCDPDHAPFEGDLSSLCWDLTQPTCSAIPEISLVPTKI